VKWEYKFVPLAWRVEDAARQLNELGDKGWEVINLVHGIAETNNAWLKREIVEDKKKP
jgi:hypothetical protein